MKALHTAALYPGRPEAAVSARQYDFFRPNEIDAFNGALYARFGDGPMFVATAIGALNIDRLLAAHLPRLMRSAQLDKRTRRGTWRTDHCQLLFELEPDCFLYNPKTNETRDPTGRRIASGDMLAFLIADPTK
jgi:hypothetical protein